MSVLPEIRAEVTSANIEGRGVAQSVAVDFKILDLLSHLLRRAHFHAEAEFAKAYDSLDATSRQLALLFAINQSQGSSQADLDEAHDIDVNNLSAVAKERKRVV